VIAHLNTKKKENKRREISLFNFSIQETIKCPHSSKLLLFLLFELSYDHFLILKKKYLNTLQIYPAFNFVGIIKILSFQMGFPAYIEDIS